MVSHENNRQSNGHLEMYVTHNRFCLNLKSKFLGNPVLQCSKYMCMSYLLTRLNPECCLLLSWYFLTLVLTLWRNDTIAIQSSKPLLGLLYCCCYLSTYVLIKSNVKLFAFLQYLFYRYFFVYHGL